MNVTEPYWWLANIGSGNRLWLGAVGHQAVTWANVDLDLCNHMTPLSHNVLTITDENHPCVHQLCYHVDFNLGGLGCQINFHRKMIQPHHTYKKSTPHCLTLVEIDPTLVLLKTRFRDGMLSIRLITAQASMWWQQNCFDASRPILPVIGYKRRWKKSITIIFEELGRNENISTNVWS